MKTFPKHKVVGIDGLIPYALNSRTHSDAQVAQIAASIKEFGFLNPIIIDGENGIIAGHGRVLAAQNLGMSELPVVEADHLTDTQRKAYVIADNRLALNAGWDNQVLTTELAALQELDFDLDLLGFDGKELAELLKPEVVEGQTDEDEVPDAPEVPVTKPGDIWILGKHRLMCGDSTSINAVDSLLNGIKADMVNTDPPYGINYQANWRVKSDKFAVLKNDDVFLDIAPVIDSCSDGWVFVWTSWKVITKWISQFESFGYPSNQVIWHKPGGGMGDLKSAFSSDYETALVWNRGKELTGKRIGSVWKIGKDSANEYKHPTQKPVALAEEAIDKTTRPNANVLDLFGGSGSTLIACEKIGRNAFLMELDEKYCDVIIKRWQDFTGQEAILKSTGETYNAQRGDS